VLDWGARCAHSTVTAGKKLASDNADFARPCKKGGWRSFSSPAFKNQGQCVKYVVHGRNVANKSA
jgi:hypothetical protein